jgi:hypothetical protein
MMRKLRVTLLSIVGTAGIITVIAWQLLPKQHIANHLPQYHAGHHS